ncbi:MAG: hypothetical protein PF450_08730 [Bacteroidales bacterium]|jgi:hypothetical protein|nr:hypothetical protein [Bacteroidales bacterium]
MLTESVEIEDKDGKIWAAHDRINETDSGRPLVIIAPGYEKTALDSLSVACYLVNNGFDVLRFDARNSCGLSCGSMESFTMTSLTKDLAVVSGYVKERVSPQKPVSMIAFSLSARSMLKFLSKTNNEENLIKAAISVVGVVDVRHTVKQILDFDHFEGFMAGERYGKRKLLTHEIDYDNFMSDTIRNNYLECASSKEDALKVTVPYYGSIMTGEDEWILKEHHDEVNSAFVNSRVEQYIIQGAGHKIWKNPRSADIAVRNCVSILSGFILNKDISPGSVVKPDITSIIEKNRLERKVILEKTYKKEKLEALNAN